MDIALILNVFLTIEAVVAFIFNLYVLVSVILTKQVCTLYDYNIMLVFNNFFELKLIVLDFFWFNSSRFSLKEMHRKSTKDS